MGGTPSRGLETFTARGQDPGTRPAEELARVTGERGAAARGWKKSAAARYWKDGARREDKHDTRLKKIRSNGSMDENEGTATAGKIFLG
jgi:hypothetical protein